MIPEVTSDSAIAIAPAADAGRSASLGLGEPEPVQEVVPEVVNAPQRSPTRNADRSVANYPAVPLATDGLAPVNRVVLKARDDLVQVRDGEVPWSPGS